MSQTRFLNSLLLKVLFAGILFIGSVAESSAQNPAVLSTISPYSRFGLGDFQMNGGLINVGMGGGGIGYRNDSLIPQYVNLLNPASLTAHPLIAYEISLSSNTAKLQTATQSGTFNRTTLGNFSLAVPVTKWWGAGFGLVPYTAVGYNVSSSASPDGIGPVTYKYEGSGGVNQVFLSNGFRPFAGSPRHYLLSEKYDRLRQLGDTSRIRKQLRYHTNLSNISIGVNTNWLFGSLTNIRRDVFPDTAYAFNTKITKRTLFRDVYMSYGVQYTFRLPWSMNTLRQALPDTAVLKTAWMKNRFTFQNKNEIDTAHIFIRKPGMRVTFGAVFALPTEINVSYDLLGQTYKQTGTIEQFRDTIINNNEIPGRVKLPAMAGFGIGLKKDYKWQFQADYMMQMWSQYTALGENANLSNSQRMTAGFQYQPRQAGRGNYMSVVQYRLGAKYFQTALELNNTVLTETSVNFGMSFPAPYHSRLGEPVARATFNVEYGFRGTTSNNLIKEEFFRVSLGVTINDKWFNHLKLD